MELARQCLPPQYKSLLTGVSAPGPTGRWKERKNYIKLLSSAFSTHPIAHEHIETSYTQ